MEGLIGQVLNEKYQIEELLGQGGMGAVYLATHLGTDRPVALKVIRPQYMADAEFIERFKREAKAAGRLRHPNVVNVTDFGFAQLDTDRVAYLVMEYLDGCSLAEVLNEEKQLPLSWVVDIIEQVCAAIEKAHQQGIIHRDLKPDNIWLEPDGRGGFTVKVLDFGLAHLRDTTLDAAAGTIARKSPGAHIAETLSVATLIQSGETGDGATLIHKTIQTDPDYFPDDEAETGIFIERSVPTDQRHGKAALTRLGSVIGTPLYMSPEQCRGERLDARSDIYSLGVIAYEMLSGRPPFSGDVHALMQQHREALPPPLEARRDLPHTAAALIMSALAKNPAQRPQSASAFASALRAHAAGLGTLLRKAIALYNEHFPSFIHVSFLLHGPAMFITFLLTLNQALIYIKIVPHSLGDALTNYLGVVLLLFLFITRTVNTLVFSLITARLLVAPLRPVQMEAVEESAWRKFFPLMVTTLKSTLLLLPKLAAFIIPGWRHYLDTTLLVPVIAIEDERGGTVLSRSRQLARCLPRIVKAITLLDIFTTTMVFLFPMATSYLLHLFSFAVSMNSKGNFELYVDTAGEIIAAIAPIIITIASIFLTPLFALIYAVLYFALRQANGERFLGELAQKFEDEITHSKWQTRMRTHNSKQVRVSH